ncbi:MAG: response regulator [Pirellulales bacterium]|nr:response regulator [Pirellulales bacterium]
MSNPTFFVQECPTCGRRLHIRVEYLGKRVVCPHCHGKLEARDPAAGDGRCASPSQRLLKRADDLLDVASLRHGESSRVSHPR